MKYIIIILFLPFNLLASGQLHQADSLFEEGIYDKALSIYLDVLRKDSSQQTIRHIALKTGEQYYTDTISFTGENLRLSSNERYLLYDTHDEMMNYFHLYDLQRNKEHILIGERARFSEKSRYIVYSKVNHSNTYKEAFNAFSMIDLDSKEFEKAKMDFDLVAIKNSRTFLYSIKENKEINITPENLIVFDYLMDIDDKSVFLIASPKDNPNKKELYQLTLKTNELTLLSNEYHFISLAFLSRDYLIINSSDGLHPEHLIYSKKSKTLTKHIGRAIDLKEALLLIEIDILDHKAVDIYHLETKELTELFQNKEDISTDPTFSPQLKYVAFHHHNNRHYNISYIDIATKEIKEVASSIEHEEHPLFVNDSTLLYVKGESRHQRSYLYNLNSGEHTSFFSNNDLRTISCEHEWKISNSGNRVIVNADRFGNYLDGISGIYSVTLSRPTTKTQLVERINSQINKEKEIETGAQNRFLRSSFSEIWKNVSKDSIHSYLETMSLFGPRHISNNGCAKTATYISEKLKEFKYEVIQQSFDSANYLTNIIGILPGTYNPTIVYVLNAHYDSFLNSPGADDNLSSVAAHIEIARILSQTPQKFTILFTFTSAEEEHQLGAKELSNWLVEKGYEVGAILNNDMIGWTINCIPEITIRHTFSPLNQLLTEASQITKPLKTYSATYIKNTDAEAFAKYFPQRIAGFGSYPMLSNPNYHKLSDSLSTLNFEEIETVTQCTFISLLYMSNQLPYPTILSLENTSSTEEVILKWKKSIQPNISYNICYTSNQSGKKSCIPTSLEQISLKHVQEGSKIEIESVLPDGLRSWSADYIIYDRKSSIR